MSSGYVARVSHRQQKRAESNACAVKRKQQYGYLGCMVRNRSPDYEDLCTALYKDAVRKQGGVCGFNM